MELESQRNHKESLKRGLKDIIALRGLKILKNNGNWIIKNPSREGWKSYPKRSWQSPKILWIIKNPSREGWKKLVAKLGRLAPRRNHKESLKRGLKDNFNLSHSPHLEAGIIKNPSREGWKFSLLIGSAISQLTRIIKNPSREGWKRYIFFLRPIIFASKNHKESLKRGLKGAESSHLYPNHTVRLNHKESLKRGLKAFSPPLRSQQNNCWIIKNPSREGWKLSLHNRNILYREQES